MSRLRPFAYVAVIAVTACSSPSSPTAPPAAAPGGRLTMTFRAQDSSFTAATDEYRRIWTDEGQRIEDVVEQLTGLSFPQTSIEAVVFEGVSISGNVNSPMMLRASNDANRKKATLVHELGHRLVDPQLTVRPADIDGHHLLDLFLYDAWELLWGRAFADEAVLVESGQRGLYDYEGTWRWALAMTREQRASRFAEIKRTNGR